MNAFSLSRANPHHPPDARSQRVLQILKTDPRLTRRHDDAKTRTLLSFLRCWQHCETAWEEYQLLRKATSATQLPGLPQGFFCLSLLAQRAQLQRIRRDLRVRSHRPGNREW